MWNFLLWNSSNSADFRDSWYHKIPHNFNFRGLMFLNAFIFFNDSAQTTFEGIRNTVYTNLYGSPHEYCTFL